MDEILYRRAKARVEERLGFYRHATIYVVVNLFLLGLNWFRSPDHWWAIWSVLGWGDWVGIAWYPRLFLSLGQRSQRRDDSPRNGA